MSFDSVCKDLDDISVKIFKLIKEYIDVKLQLEEIIKRGSLHLAKSRYIMGNKSVSVVQLPTENSLKFYATTRVVTNRNADSNTLDIELYRISPTDGAAKEVRSRFLRTISVSEGERNSLKNIENVQDPLKWFGVLVPRIMRQAQSCFNEALNLIIQCANMQLEIRRLQNIYLDKLAVKKVISSESV